MTVMSAISRVDLFGKLNPLLYKAVEGATVFCKLRGNPYIEVAHWLHQLLLADDSDLHRVVRHFSIDAGQLAASLNAVIDRLPAGANQITDFSDDVEFTIERAWVYSTLLFDSSSIRSATLLFAMLKTERLQRLLGRISAELAAIDPDALHDAYAQIIEGSPESHLGPSDQSHLAGVAPGESSQSMSPAAMGKQDALKRFAVDLTERARQGEIDPVIGRNTEIRQLVDILMRRRQNNPLLTGEAGVGKTAVVEGFALRIAEGDVPPALQGIRLLMLDVGLLQAGASMKGEFEQRLSQIIDEVQNSPVPIILFIDEVHTLIGAGGAAGTGDAANLLKPALARGNLRTIGATTWSEYKKHIEKDPALTRRFQVVQIDEPEEDNAIAMLRGLTGALGKHHGVHILDEALQAAVKLSHRYIPARQLPDKAISLLDTTCARVAISQHTLPAQLEDCRRRIAELDTELSIIAHEKNFGIDAQAREQRCLQALGQLREEEAALEPRWEEERVLAHRLVELRNLLKQPAAETDEADDGAIHAYRDEHESIVQRLAARQGESPLVLPAVDETSVAAVLADWTGIPVGKMLRNEIATVLSLADTLEQRVAGQRHALDMISRRIQTARARLDNPDKPIGVFMLAGPSGVGKTETALALAETLYGGDQNLITINMSEFQEAHSVSTLKGAPPGYVGYGEGGVLTEAVRRKPYSVVLLDEIEKAHPDVHELFFQVFDKGRMEDGEGRQIDFRNTIILLTSNVGTELVMQLTQEPELMPEPDALAKALRPALLEVFPPAFLGRLVAVPYYPLSPETLETIVRLQLERICQRTATQHDIAFTYAQEAVDLIIRRCSELESGGRMIDAILTQTVLPAISHEYLTRLSQNDALVSVHMGAGDDEFEFVFEGGRGEMQPRGSSPACE